MSQSYPFIGDVRSVAAMGLKEDDLEASCIPSRRVGRW